MQFDWSSCPDVERHPSKMSGSWVLKGTRMPVSIIFDSLADGASLEDILSWYEGLDAKQLRAVVAFAGRSASPPPVPASA
jgi:uncharacterized protein (DUF433 family)